MKTTILRISAFVLLFSLFGPGCEKDKSDYAPDNIIGKWEWIESWYVGFMTFDKIYPEKGQIKVFEFTDDGVLIIKENGNTLSSGKVELIYDTLIYYDIDEVRRVNTIEIKNDTLILKNEENSHEISYPVLSKYTRIN